MSQHRAGWNTLPDESDLWPLVLRCGLCRWSSAGRTALSTSSEDGSPTGRDLARLPESTGWVSSFGCVCFWWVCDCWGCVTHAHEHCLPQCPTKANRGQLIFFGSPCMLCTVHGRLKKKKSWLWHRHIIYIVPSCISNLANFKDPSPAAWFTIVGLNQWISHGCLGRNTNQSDLPSDCHPQFNKMVSGSV